jgi:nitrous oxidase accessory protein
VAIAVVGLADFYKWEYDYGHDLDHENAIIKIPGMNYQPPLIGSKQLLNFRAHSWPASGGWILIAACAAGVLVSGLEWRRGRGGGSVAQGAGSDGDGGGREPAPPRRAGAPNDAAIVLTAGLLALTAACAAPEPRPVEAGVDRCEHCLMTVADEGHGSEILTPAGRAYIFDSIECMAAHLNHEMDDEAVHSAWVTDFANAPALVRAELGAYLVSDELASPMGLGITAFARAADRDEAIAASGGRALDWPGVQALVDEAWPDGRPPRGGRPHGGHGSALVEPAMASRAMHVVAPGGPFRTIADAVAAAEPHDTVLIRKGVYREPTIVVDRPLTLAGEPGAVLDGEGARGLLDIVADSVTVTGLVFRDTGRSFTDDRAALKIEKTRFCRIEDNHFERTFFGIYLADVGDCVITGNTMRADAGRETLSGNGIHLWYSVRVSIVDNVISGHRDGIYFEFVEDSQVRNNDSSGNLRYGLHFMFSDGCDYRGNRFATNGAGVAVMYTRDVVMEGNDFDHNRGTAAVGLLLKDITDSRITGNRFRRNSVALHADGANRLTVSGNEFVQNGWAVQLMANSDESRFEKNNFAGNSFDVSTNSRRTYSTFDGNHWDRYRGYDLDRDGAGDVPFRPVRLFTLVVERNRPTLVLARSFLVMLLDLAEQVLPVLTPANLIDETPAIDPLPTAWRSA